MVLDHSRSCCIRCDIVHTKVCDTLRWSEWYCDVAARHVMKGIRILIDGTHFPLANHRVSMDAASRQNINERKTYMYILTQVSSKLKNTLFYLPLFIPSPTWMSNITQRGRFAHGLANAWKAWQNTQRRKQTRSNRSGKIAQVAVLLNVKSWHWDST